MSSVNEQNAAFEELIDRLRFTDSDPVLNEKSRNERRARCDDNEFAFCLEYFPRVFHDTFNDAHRFMESHNIGFYGISGSRKFGKSAYGIVAKIIKRICKGGPGLIGHALRDEKAAKQRTSMIYKIIRRNKKLCYDYNINFQQKLKGHYIINNKEYVALGMREGLRDWMDEEFKRFELIIADDLFNKQSVKSDVDNQKVLDFIQSECMGQLNEDGVLYWFYNMISENSPGMIFSEEHPECCFNLPALNAAGETNWPGSQWTTQALLAKKAKMNLDVWQGDYMNEPITVGDVFKIEWQKFVDVSHHNIIATICVLDPSHGSSPAACLKGGVLLGMTDKRVPILLDVYGRTDGYEEFFNWVDSKRSSLTAFRALLFENDFAQWDYAKPYYEKWHKETGKSLPIIMFNSSQLASEDYGADKVGRIMNLVYPFQFGEILINQDIKQSGDFKTFNTQYITFGSTKKKLDILDALASAFLQIHGYISGENLFSSSGKRQHSRRRNSDAFKNW